MTCSVWPTTYAVSPAISTGDRQAADVRNRQAVGVGDRHAGGVGDRQLAKLQEACMGFAALLWEEVLKSGGGSLVPARMAGGGVFRGLAYQALAMHLAKAGGLSDFLYRAMATSLPAAASLPIAAGRPGGGCEKGTG